MEDSIEKRLMGLKTSGLKRSLTVLEGPQAPRAGINGKEVVVLCSNDYLGLANHPAVKEAAARAIGDHGTGAGASRLVAGTMELHMELEDRLSAFKKTEAALLFNSGWHANTGCIPALVSRGDDIFCDKLSHASIIDGCILSRANLKRYPHGDMNALEGLLKRSRASRKLVITDGVFSMDGDIAPLDDILGLAERYGATLLLDDAHATGVLGRNGRGTLEHIGIDNPSVIQLGTLGKAFGSYGAFVAGSRRLIEFVMNTARSFIYSTALPPAVCAASIKAIDIVEGEPERRERLLRNASLVRDGLKKRGLDTLCSTTQIIPLVVGDAARTMEATRRLLDRGVFVQGIRPPTVPQGTSRLRITVTSEHSTDDLERAVETITEVAGELIP